MKNSFPCSKIWRKSPKIEKFFSEPPEIDLFFYKKQGIKIFALAVSRQNTVVNIPYHKCELLLMLSRLRGSLHRWSANPADFLKNTRPQPKISENGEKFRLWTKFSPSSQKVLAMDEKNKAVRRVYFLGQREYRYWLPAHSIYCEDKPVSWQQAREGALQTAARGQELYPETDGDGIDRKPLCCTPKHIHAQQRHRGIRFRGRLSRA